MLETQAFISVPEASQEVRDIGDNDDLARRLIVEGSEEMETILDRQVVTRGTITEHHYFRKSSSELYLRWFPVISITSVHEDSTRAYTNAALTQGTDYTVDLEKGKLTRIVGDSPSAWLFGFEAVRVVWVGGYANQAAVPGDLKRIARELFAEKYREVLGQRQGLSNVSDGLGSRASYGPAELTNHMLGRLRRHKNYDAGGDTRTRWSVAA